MKKIQAPRRQFVNHHPVPGVFYLPVRDKWQVMVRRRFGKGVRLTFQKRFYEYSDAVLVRDAATRLVHGDKAELSFPQHSLPPHIPEALVLEWLDDAGFTEETLAPRV